MDQITISTDKERLNIDYIHAFLSTQAYWSLSIPIEIVRRSIAGSLCFGVYDGDQQIGFARVISDFATFGYLADVFIDPAWRGRGLSKRLMETIFAHPDLQGFRRFMLATQDAHELYSKYGFTPLSNPERLMQKVYDNMYIKQQ